MRFTRLHVYCIYFTSVRCNVFSLSLSQPPGFSPSENLFLNADLNPPDSNLLFDDDSDSDFDPDESYSMELEPEPIIDNNNALVTNSELLLSDASDECIVYPLPPSRRVVRARANSDSNSCTNPAVNPTVNLEDEIPIKMTTADEIQELLVPRCQCSLARIWERARLP